MLVCAFLDAHCTRDRGCGAHPVFPAPSDFEGKVFLQNSGRIAPREQERMSHNVIASEAKQSMLPHKERMDCFASLAMTGRLRTMVRATTGEASWPNSDRTLRGERSCARRPGGRQ